jgi:hypothetical protein
MHGFDDEAEDESAPRLPSKPAIHCPFGHRITDNLENIGEMGPSCDGAPEGKGRRVVSEQGSDQMPLSPVRVCTQKIRQMFDQSMPRDQTAPASGANHSIPHLARGPSGAERVWLMFERWAT